ncbi:MAG: hypothetical protein ABEJ72_00980 [Candidatus Aenigmatarchaeota archaeon]
MAGMRKGQVFIIGALLFSSLMLMVFFATGNVVQGQSSSLFQDYYSQSFSETATVFNQALEESSDPEYIKRELYSYDRFVEVRSNQKGIDYSSMNFFVMPQKGKAVLINYQDTSVEANVSFDGNPQNVSVGSGQWHEFSFTKGTVKVVLETDKPFIDTNFDTSSPRLVNYARMARENEIWTNYRIH